MLKQLIQQAISTTGYQLTRIRKYNNRDTRWPCWPGQEQIAQTYFEIDEKFHDLYEFAQNKTQMRDTDHPIRRQRHYTLNYLLWNTNLNDGEVCELGCRRGLSAYQIATHIKTLNRKIIFHIFDSFEGLSELLPVDVPHDRRQNNETLRKEYACPLEIVSQNLCEFNFIQYHKGWIPTKFPDVQNKKFSFVHVDVDLYQPIYDSIKFFYPRLVKHGVMVFDDYGCMQFPGAKKAVDQHLAEIGGGFLIPLPSGQAFLIKDLK